MGGIQIPDRIFSYVDRQMPEPVCLIDWVPVIRPEPTQVEVDAVIEMLAEEGAYFDEYGSVCNADEVLSSLAQCWRENPQSLPGPVYLAFEKQVHAIAWIQKFGV